MVSLALPVAFLIEHVYVLPFNSKPAALFYYETEMYSYTDTFKFGFTMMSIAWVLNVVARETWFRILGHHPARGFRGCSDRFGGVGRALPETGVDGPGARHRIDAP